MTAIKHNCICDQESHSPTYCEFCLISIELIAMARDAAIGRPTDRSSGCWCKTLELRRNKAALEGGLRAQAYPFFTRLQLPRCRQISGCDGTDNPQHCSSGREGVRLPLPLRPPHGAVAAGFPGGACRPGAGRIPHWCDLNPHSLQPYDFRTP